MRCCTTPILLQPGPQTSKELVEGCGWARATRCLRLGSLAHDLLVATQDQALADQVGGLLTARNSVESSLKQWAADKDVPDEEAAFTRRLDWGGHAHEQLHTRIHAAPQHGIQLGMGTKQLSNMCWRADGKSMR